MPHWRALLVWLAFVIDVLSAAALFSGFLHVLVSRQSLNVCHVAASRPPKALTAPAGRLRLFARARRSPHVVRICEQWWRLIWRTPLVKVTNAVGVPRLYCKFVTTRVRVTPLLADALQCALLCAWLTAATIWAAVHAAYAVIVVPVWTTYAPTSLCLDVALGRAAPAACPYVAAELGAVKLEQVARIVGVDVGAAGVHRRQSPKQCAQLQ